MFGRGAIASVCGWTLEQAGHDVEFYVRPGRAAAYGETISLDLFDTRRRLWGQRVVEKWPVRFREELGPDHDFDLIVLSVPHHRLAEATAFLAPRVGGATVLMFGNIWSEPLTAIGAIPEDRVVWGFPQGGGSFGEDGVLRGMILPSVIFGTLDQRISERGRVVRQTFRDAGCRLKERPDFRGWLWMHFVADAGLHAQGLKLGSLSDLLGATGALREALLTSRELLPLVEARGVDLRRYRGWVLAYRAPSWLTARALSWVLTHIALARRGLEVHADPDAEEPRAICRDTLREARRLGVAVPRLEAAEPSFANEETD